MKTEQEEIRPSSLLLGYKNAMGLRFLFLLLLLLLLYVLLVILLETE